MSPLNRNLTAGLKSHAGLKSRKEEKSYFFLALGYLGTFLGFIFFLYTVWGTASLISRMIYFLAGSDTELFLLELRVLWAGSLMSLVIFFLGAYCFNLKVSRTNQSPKELNFRFFGLRLIKFLLWGITLICLTFLFWLRFWSPSWLGQSLILTMSLIYGIFSFVLGYKSIVELMCFKKRKGMK
jgi:hypothetical protein